MKLVDQIGFDAQGLVITAITDHQSNRLLVLCYMNREALERTLCEGRVYVYRRSRQQVMLKGETSGHIQTVREIRLNCDENSLEIRVEQQVAACHAGYFSCYYRHWDAQTESWVIHDQPVFDPDKVYAS
jgi:phosphoribosyl-AMP cyclohydrolase